MKILIALVCTVIGLALGAFGSVLFLQAPPPPPPPPAVPGDSSGLERELESQRRLIADLEDEVERLEYELARARESGGDARRSSASKEDESDEIVTHPGRVTAATERLRREREDLMEAGETPVPALTPEEILALVSSNNPRDRIQGLRALELLPDRQQAIGLAREAIQDGAPWMRMQAMETLIALAGDGAVPDLGPLLKSDTDWLARTAARRLGELGAPEAIPMLEQTYASPETQSSLKLETALALQRLGATGPIYDITQSAVTDLSSEDGTLRARALRTLTQVGDPSLAYHFSGALHDANSEVRRSAINGLAQHGTAADLPTLEAMLQDPVSEVVRAAERAIQIIQNPEAREEAESRGTRSIPTGR